MFLALLDFHADGESSEDCDANKTHVIGVFESMMAACAYGYAREFENNFAMGGQEDDKLAAYALAALLPALDVEDRREEYLGEAQFTERSFGYRLRIVEVSLVTDARATPAAEKLRDRLMSAVKDGDIELTEGEIAFCE